jgi:hypothetical protein
MTSFQKVEIITGMNLKEFASIPLEFSRAADVSAFFLCQNGPDATLHSRFSSSRDVYQNGNPPHSSPLLFHGGQES